MIHVTSFPVRLLETISSQLRRGLVGLIYLHFAESDRFETKGGRDGGDGVLHVARVALDELCATVPIVFEQKMVGDDFFVYAALGDRSPDDAYRALADAGAALAGGLERALRARLPDEPGLTIGNGCSLLQDTGRRELETVLYTAMKQAIRHAKDRQSDPGLAESLKEFHTILAAKAVSSVYQPIVSLADGSVYGYEALTRGPEASPLRSPLKLFELAERADKLYAFDKLTREKAILGCTQLLRNQRVFLNIPARILDDPSFLPGQTLPLLQQLGLTPNNVVFEITERSSIEDFTMAKKVIAHYRSQGYLIAIDDAGAGYSSLQAIAEIQPDFIKVDRSLIHNIHKDKVKEYILETFVTFSRRLNIKMIAEGIESAEELDKLLRLGVHYAQGYYLGMPAPVMADALPEARERISSVGKQLSAASGMLTIGDIVSPVKTFASTAAVSEAAHYFREHPEQLGAVVVEGDKPLGLMMREQLFRKLAVQYGISLYWNKPVTVVVDEQSLAVEASAPLETVSQLAMMRETSRLYDLVIVTEHGALAGVATVRDILEKMTNIRMEHARVSNPLTGLPGNKQIQRELQRRILNGDPFSVVYVDLDFFKWFNDLYGFQRGDEVIQYTADVLKQSLAVCGGPLDFLGHIGGDDFIAMTSSDSPQTLCEEMIRRFHAGIDVYYEGQLRLGFVEDRHGNRFDADGLSLSVSLIRIDDPDRVSVDAISQSAAVCKKEAKARVGSSVAYAYLPEPYGASSDNMSSNVRAT